MRLAIFDMDGTILDTIHDIHACLTKTLISYGFDTFDIEKTKILVGDGMRQLIINAAGESGLTDIMEKYFRAVYAENMMNTTDIMPGFENVLDYLQKDDITAVVLSNKKYQLTESMMKKFRLDSVFSECFGGDSFNAKKPSHIPVSKIIEKYKVEPENTIMIGDNYSDILSGAGAGAKTCFCSYGYGTLRSVKSDYTADSPEDIIKILEEKRAEKSLLC